MVLFSLNFRYGSVFKTSLVGNLVAVSGHSVLNQYIFKEEGKSVYCSYTDSALKIMGEQSLLAYHGVFHKYLKNLTLSMIGPESLKEVLLHETDAITRKYLHSCSNYASFDVKEESANVSDPLIDFLISKPAFSMGKFHPVRYSNTLILHLIIFLITMRNFCFRTDGVRVFC